MCAATKPFSIEDLVSALHGLPHTAFDETESICRVLREMPVSPSSLAPYLTWDRQHYTRNLIDKTALYELLAICWDIGQASSVHNHRDQNCWMAAPIGRLQVENFHVVHEDSAAGLCKLQATDTIEINISEPCAVDPQAPVHRVLNPREFNERAVSLHIYSRPFDTCVVYSAEQGTCGEIQLHYNTIFGKASGKAGQP
jgi:cysteine dioxygenase